MIAFAIGFLAPFLLGIYLSFCDFTTVTDAEFIGIGNYLKILGDAEFIHSLWYTALFTIVTVILINVLAFAVALLLTKGIRGTNVFRTVFFMPNLIGGIVLGYVWQLLLNGVLAHFERTLTYSEWFGFWGLVILMLWQQIGYMMIIYIAGLQSIPGDVMEAAQIDGLGKIGVFFYIMLPLGKVAVIAQTILWFIGGYNEYFSALLYLNSESMFTVQLVLKQMVGSGADGHWDYIMACAVLVMIPLLLIYIFAQRFLVEGIATTGLKE